MNWIHRVTVPLNQGTVPLFELHQIKPEWCDTELYFTRNSQLIHVHSMRDRNPKISDLHRWPPKEECEVKRYLLVFAPICFLWNNLWSVSRYIMGPFSGWWRLVGRTIPVSNPPIWKCRSGIGDHRFPFFMDLLPNYTFYTNLTFFVHWTFAYRRCDNRDNVQFMKSWENYATSFDAGLNHVSTSTDWKERKKIKVARRYFIKWKFFLRSVANFCKSARCP